MISKIHPELFNRYFILESKEITDVVRLWSLEFKQFRFNFMIRVLILLEERILINQNALADSLEVIFHISTVVGCLEFFIEEMLRLFHHSNDYTLNNLKYFLIINAPGLFESIPVILCESAQVLNRFDKNLFIVICNLVLSPMKQIYYFLVICKPKCQHKEIVNQYSTDA